MFEHWLVSGLLTFGALQAADVATTQRAIRAGAVERNALYGDAHLGRMLLIKAAVTGAVTLTAVKLPKKGGVALTWGLNGVYAGVVFHNIGVVK